MIETIEDLTQKQAVYIPSVEVAKSLQQITMVPVIGPTAVGKSATINSILDLDLDFGRVTSFTTRPWRRGESKTQYKFRPHDDENIKIIGSAVNEGIIVQYAVHPTTGYIYGSDISDYSHPNMLMDTLYSAVEPLRKLPFGRMVEITLVSSTAQWLNRYGRRSDSVDETIKRLKEGIDSIKWSLEQGDNMIWVDNSDKKVADVAKNIRDIVFDKTQPDQSSRFVGEKMLRTFQTLLE